MKNLKEKAIRGGFAKLCGQAANFALRVISVVALARLLEPEDFGLVTMVTVVTGVYGLFSFSGLSSATIQRATVTDDQISALFWINMTIGATLAILCLATAPALVFFYHEPRLFWATIATAVGFLFNAAGVQHTAVLQRQLRYIALSIIETLSQAMGLVAGIGMALAGFGYWALVAAPIVSSATGTAGVWLTTGWIPGMPRRGIRIGSMLRYGGTITLNGLVVYVAYNFEKLLLGRFWGADALGIYGRAYQLINIPTDNLNAAVGVVAFSALSRLQDDPDRLRGFFLKGYSLVVSMTLPITAFSALFADDIILVVLGPKWADAAAIFRLLAPTILVFGMINPLFWLLIATGLQARSLKIALVIAPLVIVSDVLGLPYGPRGVAFAYSAAMVVWLVPHIAWCLHGTVVSGRDILTAVSRPLLSCIAAAALTVALQSFLDHRSSSAILRLALGGGVMLAAYVLVLLFVMGQKSFYLGVLKDLIGRPQMR